MGTRAVWLAEYDPTRAVVAAEIPPHSMDDKQKDEQRQKATTKADPCGMTNKRTGNGKSGEAARAVTAVTAAGVTLFAGVGGLEVAAGGVGLRLVAASG